MNLLAGAQLYLRHLSMLLALTAGTLHVAELWQAPISQSTLWAAGRGALLLLLALGLMGSARLSLILAIAITSTGLMMHGGDDPMTIASFAEIALLCTAVGALPSAILTTRNPATEHA